MRNQECDQVVLKFKAVLVGYSTEVNPPFTHHLFTTPLFHHATFEYLGALPEAAKLVRQTKYHELPSRALKGCPECLTVMAAVSHFASPEAGRISHVLLLPSGYRVTEPRLLVVKIIQTDGVGSAIEPFRQLPSIPGPQQPKPTTTCRRLSLLAHLMARNSGSPECLQLAA